MEKLLPYAPIILIIALFICAFVAYNKLIGNQAKQTAIYELTAKQIEEMNQRHAIEMDSLQALKTFILKQDTLIQKQNEKIDYLRKQNDAIFHRYSNISINLPEL